MTVLRRLGLFVSILWLTAGSALAAPDLKTVTAGDYKLDPSHTSISFNVNHLGFSSFASRFDKVDGTLTFDPAKVEASKLAVTIDAASVNTNSAKLDDELRKADNFNVAKFPTMTFTATKIERTSETTGKVTGDFTMLGVTKPVTLDVTFFGAGEHPFYKKPVVGFTATGMLLRSEFGMKTWLPMVGDEVTFRISAEFNKS
jgi:polyisoprenoid-binding protein YceI